MSYGNHEGYGLAYGEITKSASYDFSLVLDSSIHTTDSSGVTMVPESSTILTPEDSYHSSESDDIFYTQTYHLSLSESVHGVNSTSPKMINHLKLSIDNSLHGVSSPQIKTTTFSLLSINNTRHYNTTDKASIIAHGQMTVHDSEIRMSSDFRRIIDWSVYGLEFGNYLEVKPEQGKFK